MRLVTGYHKILISIKLINKSRNLLHSWYICYKDCMARTSPWCARKEQHPEQGGLMIVLPHDAQHDECQNIH